MGEAPPPDACAALRDALKIALALADEQKALLTGALIAQAIAAAPVKRQ
jgi:hypothetical protein